jgi:N-acetylglucosaminyldiphosphoundecaprenol N-acetyl-beta-D-mannosaminyltransferase
MEHLSALWGADAVIAEYMPAVRISRYLGPALKECIRSGDLISRIAEEALKREKSVLILGSREESVKHAKIVLEDSFPGLMVAGLRSLPIHSEGIESPYEYERDTATVDEINASSADILFISMDSPDQEIWFERNRSALRVPLCVCVGDIFTSIAGSQFCSPAWARCPALENLFHSRRTQRHTEKYSLLDLIKLFLRVLPSILLHGYSKAGLHMSPRKLLKRKVVYRYWTRGTREIFSLTLPETIDSGAAHRLILLIPKNPGSHLVLDFSAVKSVDSAGLGFFFHLFSLWNKDNYEVMYVGLSSFVKRILNSNRIHRHILSRVFASQDKLIAHLDENAGG